jgi:hydroxyacylglutathione hydrolase
MPTGSTASTARPLKHGDVIKLGNVRLEAVHTPGHTPEHLSFLVTDGATSEQPGFYLTGDFVFVGDVGRPDLLDEAAGGVDTRFGGAKRLFASLRDHFLTLPDHVQVWPGHGAGSACGKALGAVPSTTVGYEKLTSWWAPLVQAGDEAGFVEALLEGQPDAPLYFGRMKRTNKAGPALLGDRAPLRAFTPAELRGRLGDDLVLVDTRGADQMRADHVPGAYFAPEGKKFATYASYAIAPEVDARGLVVLARDAAHAAWMRDRLAWTGIDRVVGYVTSLEGLTAGPAPRVAPAAVDGVDAPSCSTCAPRASTPPAPCPAPCSATSAASPSCTTTCRATGRSSSTARPASAPPSPAAALRALGFGDVRELTGSYEGWRDLQRNAVPA